MKKTFLAIFGVVAIFCVVMLYQIFSFDMQLETTIDRDRIEEVELVKEHIAENPNDNVKVTYIPNIEENKDIIRITDLKPNQVVSNNFFINGEARGWWFDSEYGNFLAAISDEHGNIFGRYDAMALTKNWDTDDFVPFRAPFVFEKPETDTGFIILERAHASEIVGGYKNTLVFPIRFR